MRKPYFHNDKVFSKNKEKLFHNFNVEKKKVVDINILLNRVKIKKKIEKKKKIIFFSFVTLLLVLFGTVIAILK